MINGFREEHYHICRGGEVLIDSFYKNLSADYEIQYIAGHYLTPVMITAFVDYLTTQYNTIFKCLEHIESDIDNLKFSDDERDVLDDGFGFLREHLQDIVYTMNISYGYGSSDEITDSVYAGLLKIPLCLERFLATYQPQAGII